MKKQLVYYETSRGRLPFNKWLLSLKDRTARSIINSRLDRLVFGHCGDCKPIKDSVYELRIAYGPGYRLYFAEIENQAIVLLLLGGSKRTQKKDIEKALAYWKSFNERYKHD